MRKREPVYKPLLFTTTVRNPERMKGLLYVLSKFNNEKLTNNLAKSIVGELIRYGLYRPMNTNNRIKEKWSSTGNGRFAERILTDEDVEFALENNPQRHKEAGFERGWPSRFATIFDFAKELGFVFFRIGSDIEFSQVGLRLANSISIKIEDNYILYSEPHPEFEQQAFLHAMAKYQRNNPFVRVLNNNVPLILLLEVIGKLNEDTDLGGAGISKLELPLVLFWKNNNADELYLRIKSLREEYGFSPSWDVVIEICENEIMEGNDVAREAKSIMVDYPDEFIRKMRLTGLISLRGGGRFIDINKNEISKISYILDKYSDYPVFDDEKEYFDYMAETDENLIFSEIGNVAPIEENEKLLSKWVEYFSWETVKKELKILSKRGKSKDEILKYLSHPIRLEFLTAIAIKNNFQDILVIPNYPIDDEGIPTSTAGGQGNKGDIECFENQNGILIEVTMSEGRTQTMLEVWPIERHLETFSEKVSRNSMCHFIAPTIFADTERQIEYVRDTKGLIIKARSIDDFLEYLETNDNLYEIN